MAKMTGLKERLVSLVPLYFRDKFTVTDFEQLEALPLDLRLALIYGSDQEAATASREIRQRAKDGVLEWGEAASELAEDFRQMNAHDTS